VQAEAMTLVLCRRCPTELKVVCSSRHLCFLYNKSILQLLNSAVALGDSLVRTATL
jgi:hypothetical protein